MRAFLAHDASTLPLEAAVVLPPMMSSSCLAAAALREVAGPAHQGFGSAYQSKGKMNFQKNILREE